MAVLEHMEAIDVAFCLEHHPFCVGVQLNQEELVLYCQVHEMVFTGMMIRHVPAKGVTLKLAQRFQFHGGVPEPLSYDFYLRLVATD